MMKCGLLFVGILHQTHQSNALCAVYHGIRLEEDVSITPSETLLNFIKHVIPFTDMNDGRYDGMYERIAEWAMISMGPT